MKNLLYQKRTQEHRIHTLDLWGCGYSADYIEGSLLVHGFKDSPMPTFAFVANMERHTREAGEELHESAKQVDLQCPIYVRGLENYCDGD